MTAVDKAPFGHSISCIVIRYVILLDPMMIDDDRVGAAVAKKVAIGDTSLRGD